jgi:hypothetical protein
MKRVLVAALLALLLLPSAASADPCDDNVFACDPSKGWPIAFPVQARQVTATVPLRTDNGSTALDTYRALVKPPYTMPARPQVGLWFVDATIPHDVGPWRPMAFTEASVAIKVVHQGEEGWFHLSQPTNGQGNYDLGRGVGFPKYLATTTFAQEGDAWHATAHRGARRTMDLRWTPGGATGDAELTRWTLFRDPLFSFNPVFSGPATRVKWTVKPFVPLRDLTFGYAPQWLQVAPVTGLPKPTDGRMAYDLDADLDTIDDTIPDIFPAGRNLADVIAPAGTATGQFWSAEGYLMSQSAEL